MCGADPGSLPGLRVDQPGVAEHAAADPGALDDGPLQQPRHALRRHPRPPQHRALCARKQIRIWIQIHLTAECRQERCALPDCKPWLAASGSMTIGSPDEVCSADWTPVHSIVRAAASWR